MGMWGLEAGGAGTAALPPRQSQDNLPPKLVVNMWIMWRLALNNTSCFATPWFGHVG